MEVMAASCDLFRKLVFSGVDSHNAEGLVGVGGHLGDLIRFYPRECASALHSGPAGSRWKLSLESMLICSEGSFP